MGKMRLVVHRCVPSRNPLTLLCDLESLCYLGLRYEAEVCVFSKCECILIMPGPCLDVFKVKTILWVAAEYNAQA